MILRTIRAESAELNTEVSHLKEELKRLSEHNESLTRELKELQLSGALYHQAVDNSPNPIFSIDPHGVIQTWNAACEATFLNKESMVGKHYQELLARPQQRDCVARKLSDVSRGHALSNLDLTYRCSDGSIREMVSRIYPLRDEQDRFYGYVFANTNVTERNEFLRELEGYRNQLEKKVGERTAKLSKEINDRRQAETALKSSYDALITILNSIDVEISVTTVDSSEVIFINRQLKEKYGEEFCEKSDFHDPTQQHRLPVGCDFTELVDDNNQPNAGCSRTLYDMSFERWYLIHEQIIRWIDGRDVRLQVATDITERRRIDEELQRVEKLESVGVLAGGIAHDFNNLLTGILGNTSLLKLQTAPESRSFSLLENLEKAATRATDLTQQLLAFSKGGAPIRKPTVIASLLDEAIEFARRGSRLTSVTDIEDDLKIADVDAGQIVQVFHNLVLNAVQAMPDGGEIKVSARNKRISSDTSLPLSPGEYIMLVFEDDGPGITADNISRIFDPYFTTKVEGNGLGLATTYTIIKKHEGHISVCSDYGSGARFTMYLPALDEQISHEKQECDAVQSGSGRILVMDDDHIVLEVATEMLTHIGFDVETASEGSEVLALYGQAIHQGQPYDAVILDLTIPGGMGGQETIKHLKELDPEVKAIVSSGYSNDSVMADFQSYGFSDVVTKPYRIKDISGVLERIGCYRNS